MRQWKPAEINVGRSTVNSPALTLLAAWAGAAARSIVDPKAAANNAPVCLILVISISCLSRPVMRHGIAQLDGA